MSEAISRRRQWTRRVFAFLVAVPFVAVLSGGHCYWYVCHDDDCDDHCCRDDDDDTGANARLGDGDLRLTRFRQETASDPDAHPLRRLYDIEGIWLFGGSGSPDLGPAELARFTRDVYEANQDLLGLPIEAGEIVFDEARFGADDIRVRWLQVPIVEAPAGRPVGEMVFVFDLVGRLREIENRTWLE